MPANDGFFYCGADVIAEPFNDLRLLASIRYNASISAMELRGLRPEGRPPSLLAAIGVSPLTVTMRGPGPNRPPVETWKVHFETATLACPFEHEPGNAPAYEVVVLRGLRFEMVKEIDR